MWAFQAPEAGSPTGFLEELLKAPGERPPSVLEPISEDELTDTSALAALTLAARCAVASAGVEARPLDVRES